MIWSLLYLQGKGGYHGVHPKIHSCGQTGKTGSDSRSFRPHSRGVCQTPKPWSGQQWNCTGVLGFLLASSLLKFAAYLSHIILQLEFCVHSTVGFLSIFISFIRSHYNKVKLQKKSCHKVQNFSNLSLGIASANLIVHVKISSKCPKSQLL